MKKNLFRRLTSIIVIISIILPCNIFVLAEDSFDYDDVKDYYPYNSWAVDIGKKYSLIFLENNRREVKRWEISNLLYNILKPKNKKSVAKSFTDLEDISDDLKNRVNTIASMDIISGYEDGTFKPLENVTRAEFVTMLDRSKILGKSTNNNVSVKFNDINNHWAKESINKIASEGILSGRGDNNFCPEDNITPQEILAILDRLQKANLISTSDVLNAMTDTFKCKRYGKEEQYIIDIMYSKFDQVQNDIMYKWPYKDKYNPENWQKLATYEDMIYALYYTILQDDRWYEEGESGREKINNVINNVFVIQGINNERSLSQTITFSNFVKAVLVANWRSGSIVTTNPEEVQLGLEKYADNIKFINIQKFKKQDKVAVAVLTTTESPFKPLFEDTNMYFPIDAPITNYMLNYLILKLQDRCEFWRKIPYGIKAVLNQDQKTDCVETDFSKMPSNYYQYPFIVKGVPKEVYEKPFIDEGIEIKDTPLQAFPYATQHYNDVVSTSYAYYKDMLNIDYRNFDIEDFAYRISTGGTYAFRDYAREYGEWVINNKIILKGKGCAIPGTLFTYGEFAYIRVILEFEILYADERKNLLFGDFSSFILNDVIYNEDKYYLCADMPISGQFYYSNNELNFGAYRMRNYPIVLGVHPGSNYNCQLP